jgi:hypothetical protein
LRGLALLLTVDLGLSKKGNLKLKQLQKHLINLDGLGIRELLVRGDDLLILAGPTMDLDGPVRLYRLANGVAALAQAAGSEPSASPEAASAILQPEYVMDLPYGNGVDHAEGMTLADALTDRPALLVAYDAPAPGRCLENPTRALVDLLALP